MPRVVMLANSLARGGAETQFVRLAVGLAERGQDVAVGTILAQGHLRTQLDRAGVPVHVLSGSRARGPQVLREALRLVRTHAPAAVLGFDHQAGLLARWVGRTAHVPIVVSSVRVEHFGGRARELLLRWTDSWATVTTTNSVLVARSLVDRGLVAPRRLVVIPNGIDVRTAQRPGAAGDAARVRAGVPADAFLWVAVGNLRPSKDYPTLVEAVARLAQGPGGTRVVVAGGGAAKTELEARASAAGVGERLHFLGRRHDVPELLAGADALVLSSVSEGLPNAIMEAQAAGLPVVATQVSGVPELVEHGRTGLVVPSRDPAALAQHMQAMMDMSPQDRVAMGERGRRHVTERFSLDAYLDRWEQVLFPDPRVVSAGNRASRVRAGTLRSSA